MSVGIKDRTQSQHYSHIISHLLVELKAKGKINPNYRESLKGIELLLTYADKSAISFNRLDLILQNIESFKKDVVKHGIGENIFMSIYGRTGEVESARRTKNLIDYVQFS